jgi:uncharacterized membrane protein SpoIIM required for sporulation
MAVNVDAFVSQRRSDWTELDGVLRRAHGRAERLGPDGVLRLASLYRGSVADLALARRSFPADPVVRMLEDRVTRARGTLYGAHRREGSARDYLLRGYWREVYELGPVLVLAWVLLAGSAALATAWGLHDPVAASGVVPGSLAGGGGGPHGAIGLAAGQSAELSAKIFTNNIGVTFLSFASGVAFGIVPAALLIFNGGLLGAVVGIGASTGHARDVVELIVPHGILELSCIAVCSAAGMWMGWALVEPGPRGRFEALTARAPKAVLLVLTTAPWLVLAGCIEGFVTPHHLPLGPALAIGVCAAAPFWCLVVWRGRPAERSEPERRLRIQVSPYASR